ncbi:MAG: hypothetical protein LBS99_00520, partial [Clostridiales bacterium]|nr:hypothetical protein [Clostridiales bacterium]
MSYYTESPAPNYQPKQSPRPRVRLALALVVVMLAMNVITGAVLYSLLSHEAGEYYFPQVNINDINIEYNNTEDYAYFAAAKALPSVVEIQSKSTSTVSSGTGIIVGKVASAQAG